MRPSVRVPVLSNTTVSTGRVRSSTSPPLMSTPSWAPRPVPTMMAVGVARPSAQGQAMMSTATAAVKASSAGWPVSEPAGERGDGDGEHDGHEDGGDPVGQALHGCGAALGLVDHADDLGQRGVGADPGRLDDQVGRRCSRWRR